MFDTDDVYTPTDKDSKAVTYVLAGILGLLFIVGSFIGYMIYYVLLIRKRQKPSVSLPVIAVIGGVLLLLGFFTHPFDIYEPKDLIYTYIYCNLWVMVFASFGLISIACYKLKKDPSFKFANPQIGEDFKFALSPKEKRKINELEEMCREGEAYDLEEGSPIGILDEPVIMNNQQTYFAPELVRRRYEDAVSHTLITGVVGSGKTQTMLNLIKNDIVNDIPVCVIDMKKSVDVVYFLSKWAKENGSEFYHFQAGEVGSYNNEFCKEQASYDPLEFGSADEKAEMILSLRNWDTASDVYMKQTRAVLSLIFYLLDAVDITKIKKPESTKNGIVDSGEYMAEEGSSSVAKFVALLNRDNLLKVVTLYSKQCLYNKRPEELTEREKTIRDLMKSTITDINNPKSDLCKQIVELGNTMHPFLTTSYGNWLSKGSTSKHISMDKIATYNYDHDGPAPVVLFSFSSLEDLELNKSLGIMVLGTLSQIIAYKMKTGKNNLFGIYIDEFATLTYQPIEQMVAKARQAKCFVTLATQSLEQIGGLDKVDGVITSILETCSNFIVHAGSTQESAERLCGIIGSEKQVKYRATARKDSGILGFNFFNRRNNLVGQTVEEDWIVPPETITKLSKPVDTNGYRGTACYITKSQPEKRFADVKHAIVRTVHVVVPNENVEPIPKDFGKKLYSAEVNRATTHSYDISSDMETEDSFSL